MLEIEKHRCALAPDAAVARKILEKNKFELIMCDINMPGESGFDFARSIVKTRPDIALVMVTAMDDVIVAQSAFEMGVYDYIVKPFDRSRVLITVANALRRRELEISHTDHTHNLERLVAQQTADLRESLTGVRMTLEGTVRAIASIVDKRDPFTAGHQKRVAHLATALGKHMDLGRKTVEILRLSAMLHDLGKIFIPPEILMKPGRLNSAEYNLVKEHPLEAYLILKDIAFPWQVAKTVLQHHEKLDGSGYPYGLEGDKILLEARILSVADTIEAMASDRSYRPSPGFAMGLEEIEKNRGLLYDKDVVDACIDLFATSDFTFPENGMGFGDHNPSFDGPFSNLTKSTIPT